MDRELEEDILSFIIEEKYNKAKQLLLSANCKDLNLNKLLRDGITILHVLAGQGSNEACELLRMVLELGADPNCPSIDLLTPVHIASIWGRQANLQLLLNYGGSVNQQDNEGLTAIDHSIGSQEPDSPACRRLLTVFSSGWLTETSENSNYQTAEETIDRDIDKTDFFEYNLDDSEIDFPELHPWVCKQNESDLDDTLVGNFRQLDIGRSNSPIDTAQPEDASPAPKDSFIYISSDDSSSESLFDNNDYELDLSDSDAFSDATIIYDWKDVSCVESPSSSSDESLCIPDNLAKLTPRELRAKLESLGEVPGPITPTTHRAYLRYLTRILTGKRRDKPKKSPYHEYLLELRNELEGKATSCDMFSDEVELCREFDKPGQTWREGCEKASFNYILLDPRATKNLPARANKMNGLDIFRAFISAMFYIGKGKRSRPNAHLYEALNLSKTNKKLAQIRDIWGAGLGVISLHCFQNVIPVEAYTREACMVEAFGLARLTNVKRGDYYGQAKHWSLRKKREFGLFLLKRAMKIFLSEGERQIKPRDLKT